MIAWRCSRIAASNSNERSPSRSNSTACIACRVGIPPGTVSHPARHPTRHGIHTSSYPAPHWRQRARMRAVRECGGRRATQAAAPRCARTV
jgi:hypothetical protein